MRYLHTIIIILIVSTTLSSSLNASTRNKKEELQSIKQEINKTKSKLQKKKAKKKDIVNKIGKIKRSLSVKKRTLIQTKEKLRYYQKQSKVTEKELSKTEDEYKLQLYQLKNRLKELYKNPNNSFLSYFFSPTDYQMALSHSYYFDKMLSADTKLIQGLKQKKQAYEKKKAKLSEQKNKVASLKEKVLKEKKTLDRKSSHYQKNLVIVQKEILAFEKEQRLLEKNSLEIQRLIQKKSKGKRRFYAVGEFLKPAKGWLSSRFGKRKHPIFKRYILHRGIDLAAPRGYKIKATNNGYIIFSGWQKGYGNVTIINHGWKNGKKYSSVYAHQSRMIVKKGQYVKKGQSIGFVGSTGYSTGPHLHFEIRENGAPINPLRFVRI